MCFISFFLTIKILSENLMVDLDYNKTFSCPKCGEIGNIYLVKVAGSKVIVKQRCPVHGGRAFKVPLKDKDKYIHLIQNAVFRCYKCGQEAEQSYMRETAPWTLVKTSCPTHGAITTQKIWGSIYNEISNKGDVTQQSAQPQPSQIETMPVEDNKFCPNCGAELVDEGRFCGECGSKLN
jgi:hypothetical protein